MTMWLMESWQPDSFTKEELPPKPTFNHLAKREYM